MRRAAAGLSALALALAAVVLAAPAAQAHNVLQSTDPAAGSTVPYVPEIVTLTFNEPVLFVGTQIMVHTADDTMVNIGPPILVDNTVSQAVTGDLPAGEYTVLYRVTSADGHPIEDQFTFTAAESITYGEMTPTPTASAEVPPSESAAPSPSPTASSPPAASEGRVSGAVLIGIVTVLVVVGAAVAWLLLRRRPTGSPTGSPTGPPPGAAPGP